MPWGGPASAALARSTGEYAALEARVAEWDAKFDRDLTGSGDANAEAAHILHPRDLRALEGADARLVRCVDACLAWSPERRATLDQLAAILDEPCAEWPEGKAGARGDPPEGKAGAMGDE